MRIKTVKTVDTRTSTHQVELTAMCVNCVPPVRDGHRTVAVNRGVWKIIIIGPRWIDDWPLSAPFCFQRAQKTKSQYYLQLWFHLHNNGQHEEIFLRSSVTTPFQKNAFKIFTMSADWKRSSRWRQHLLAPQAKSLDGAKPHSRHSLPDPTDLLSQIIKRRDPAKKNPEK